MLVLSRSYPVGMQYEYVCTSKGLQAVQPMSVCACTQEMKNGVGGMVQVVEWPMLLCAYTVML